MDETTTKAVAKAVLVIMVSTLGAEAGHHTRVAQVQGVQLFFAPSDLTATKYETHNEARGSAGIAMRRPVAQTSAAALDIEAFDIVRVENSGDVFTLA